MMNHSTFAETEATLKIALGLRGSRKIKEIAAITQINANTLYTWKSSDAAHLGIDKADRLLDYFRKNEPERLTTADRIREAISNHNTNIDMSSSS